MKKIIRLTENDLMKLVRRVIKENQKIEFGSREYSMDDIENDDNMIVMKYKHDELGDKKMVFAIERVHQKKTFDGTPLLTWFFNCIHLADLLNDDKIRNIGKPQKITIRLSDEEYAQSFLSRGLSDSLESLEIFIDHPKINLIPSSYEDGNKIIKKCMENDESELFDKEHSDFSNLEFGLDKDEIMESRRYKKHYRR
jgi:hypothetical protein